MLPYIKVLMKDIVTPVPQEEVKAVIRKCLEQAALTNYTRLSEYAKIEGKVNLILNFNVSIFFQEKEIFKSCVKHKDHLCISLPDKQT